MASNYPCSYALCLPGLGLRVGDNQFYRVLNSVAEDDRFNPHAKVLPVQPLPRPF